MMNRGIILIYCQYVDRPHMFLAECLVNGVVMRSCLLLAYSLQSVEKEPVA